MKKDRTRKKKIKNDRIRAIMEVTRTTVDDINYNNLVLVKSGHVEMIQSLTAGVIIVVNRAISVPISTFPVTSDLSDAREEYTEISLFFNRLY